MPLKTASLLAASALLLAAPRATHAQAAAGTVQFKGSGFVQSGYIEQSSDHVSNGVENNFNKNWISSAGGSFTALSRLDEHWEAAFGLGVVQTNNARGSLEVANNWYTFYGTSVNEARVSYNAGSKEGSSFLLNMGLFNYIYNPDVRDLGLYLFRGMPYPGTLISGFEMKGTTAAPNIYGMQARYAYGTSIKNDVVLVSETDHRPYFDLSLADVVTWRPSDAFELGLGANFYRLMPRNGDVTSPDKGCNNEQNNYSQITNIFGKDDELCYILDQDTVTGVVDTVLGSMAGTKLMGRFRVDPKALFGMGQPFGKDDLVLYVEMAVYGLKDYPKYYADIKRRMPVMVGFNLPAFGFLDKASIEVEYFANKNFNDYGKAETTNSWVPRKGPGGTGRDDWKWSFYASKVLSGHVKLSAQVANDHLRTYGAPDIGFLTYAEALTTPKDWYWMTKMAYFF